MFIEYLPCTQDCNKWGWGGNESGAEYKNELDRHSPHETCVLMGRQTLITIKNAIMEKSSMQGKCKIYLVWESFPKVTTYLKNEKG